MTDQEFLDVFGSWVGSLKDDATAIRAGYELEGAERDAKRILVAGLSYLLRKIDIVPDYLGGLGSVDDAMVLRLTAAKALAHGLAGLDGDTMDRLTKMAGEGKVVQGFLGDDYAAFDRYVDSLPDMAVRGRTADAVIDDAGLAEQFGYELNDELKSYEARPIEGGDKAIRELRSFVRAKVNRKK